MYHFDHPYSLEKSLNGWGSSEMVDKFVEYADFLFDTFGKKVRELTPNVLSRPHNK